MSRDIPTETVSTPAEVVDARTVYSRHLDGRPPVLVIRGSSVNENRSSSSQIVVGDWKAAENLAYEILEEVQQWPGE